MAGMRRFIIGVISGGVVAGLGLGVVSQITTPQAAKVVDPGGDAARNGLSAVGAPSTDLADDTAAGVVAEVTLPPTRDPGTDGSLPLSGAASDAVPVVTPPGQTHVSGAASDAVDVASVPDSAATDTPIDEVSATEQETQASGTSPASEVAQVETAVEPAVPEGAVVAEPEPPAIPETPATTAVAAGTPTEPPAIPEQPATTVLADAPPPSAVSLIDSPQPQTAPIVPYDAAAPAAETTTALGATGPDVPRQPGADPAPPLADLPPPPPLTPAEQRIVAETPAAAPTEDTAVIFDETLEALPDVVLPADSLPEAAAAENLPEPEPEPEPEVIAMAPVEPAAPTVIDVDAAPSLLQPDTPLIETAPALPAAPSLGGAGEGVIVNRPSLAEAAPSDDIQPLPEVALDDQPPVARFAAPFDNPDAKPLFSIVLIDTGEATLDRAAIAALPFAVSVVVDPLSPDAAVQSALYRAGGKEVLMLASGIPEGATPVDLEQTFEAHATALPEAVAVVDTEEASFQNDRPLATQIVPILAAQGRGLLTWDRGLNAADQVARREGLVSAVIFRRIDGDGEDVPEIRRYLDRAAFKAAQDGGVTVIGEARPETVAALVEWTIEGRASTVAIAPISAQLSLP
jgi:uncharacterized protein